MTITIHTTAVPLLDPDLLRRWGGISTTITADLFQGKVLADPQIRPLQRLASGRRLAGRALTIRCEPPDFGAVLHAVDRAERGDVLVIAADGDRRTAMIGDILSGVARRRGVAGVICDGAVRDVGVVADGLIFRFLPAPRSLAVRPRRNAAPSMLVSRLAGWPSLQEIS